MLKRLCFTVLLIIIFSISVFSSEELVFDSQMIRIEKLGEEQVLGESVDISILNDDGSSYSKSAKIDISLGYTDGKVFSYCGIKYSPEGKNLVRFPFGILQKYDIIYLKALLEEGNTIETFYNIPELNNQNRFKSMGLTEGVEIFDDTASRIFDCVMKTIDDGSIKFGYTIFGTTTAEEDQIKLKNITFPADDPVISDLISIPNEHSNGSIWDPRISSSGEIYYYKNWCPPYEIYISSNLPESWSREGSYSFKSKFENGTPLFSEDDFFKVRMQKNLECHCYWFWPFPPIYEYEYNGYYKLFKEKGYEGKSIYSYHNTFAFDGNKTIYVTVNRIGHTKREKCHGDAGEGWEVTEIVPRSENYEISLPGPNLEFDYHDNYVTDVGIIDNVGKDSQTISFYVNNGVLNWSYSTELLSNPDCYNYRFNYIKSNDNEIFIFQQEMDKYSKNQDCIHITFPPPNPPPVSFLRDDINPPPIIERFEMPSENFARYSYAQYYFKKDSSGEIHFLELYKHYSGGYKTKFYLGTFNSETYEFQKREIGNLDFNSFADFDIDNDGNIYVFYKSDEYIYPNGNDKVSIVKIEQEEEIPELSIEVYTDENCTKKIDLDTYYPQYIEEKLYVRVESETNVSKDLKANVILRNTNGGTENYIGFLFEPITNQEAKNKTFTIPSGEQNSNFEEITYYPRETAGTIVQIVIDKVNENELKEPIIKEVPKDADDDQMADAWEREEIEHINNISNINEFTPDWDGELPDVQGVNNLWSGDGFSAFIEYTGYTCIRERIGLNINSDLNNIKQMSSSEIDLFFTSTTDRFDSNTILTNDTKSTLGKYNIKVHEILNLLPVNIKMTSSDFYINMKYENFASGQTGLITTKDSGTTYGKIEEGTSGVGTGNGTIIIYQGAVNNLLAIPNDPNFPNNPVALNYRIGNWVHEKFYREKPFKVHLCSYKDGGNPEEIEIYFNEKEGKDVNNDGDFDDWINLYDIADNYDDYNDPQNTSTRGTPICHHWELEEFMTRFQLHEIGHKMNFGIGNRNGYKLTHEDAWVNRKLPPAEYIKQTCMWWGIVDIRYHMIVKDYDPYVDFKYFRIIRK
ncbi:hypothetical protein KAU33_00210 [Candidatus Dependentiae bacterium]|nr:hypothetical protein [Candidatus Dependentiae bacterium]